VDPNLRLDRLSASLPGIKMGLSPRIYWIRKNTYYKQVYWHYKHLPEISVCEFFYIQYIRNRYFSKRRDTVGITVNSCKFTLFSDSIYFKIKTKKRLCCMQIAGRRTANFKFHCERNKEQFCIHIFGSLLYVITILFICQTNQTKNSNRS
jgi:hypothetical protein